MTLRAQNQTLLPSLSVQRRGIPKWLTHLLLIVISTMAIIPFLWMLGTSLKTLPNAMSYPPQFFPHPFMWENYRDVLNSTKDPFLLWARNSLIITGLSVVGITISSTVVAYGFAKIHFRGRGILFAIMLATMMIPFPVTMVSLFALYRWLTDHTGFEIIGTFRPLWMPAWFGSAFSIFLLRQFFMTIPDELSDAARIDGCSELGILWHIILPLARPAILVVALFAFMASWNDFMGPYIFLQRPEQFTLALGLQNYQSQLGGSQWNLLMAAGVMVIAPVLLLFFIAQRAFIQGISTTGIKG
jgi:multiple sugar transport system permease protein